MPIIGNIMKRGRQAIPEAMIFAFPPPAIFGLGTTGGFELRVEDQKGTNLAEQLQQVVDEMVEAGNKPSRA